ncbi:DUF6953 family protein [Paenibacillus crassostreae]|uniref:Integron gene cassette protein n=1 Tax=Paenibacillus crassostreae TaxID=1763538 RepID=A0A167G3F2_9BACL|nr:hypothetical protein [Paenibacillus crassostreae]AOZ93797.1 hypothetical protein LPB68_17505 [Paenibacillus crassostreae]OAB77169.1 hypothetical protein PNBC_07230 [Paenibacillus crassostreae]
MEWSADQIAEWMYNEVKSSGKLLQTEAVTHISEHFGEQYIYVNEHGNSSIAKDVKKAFKKLHGGRAAWDRDSFYWYWT